MVKRGCESGEATRLAAVSACALERRRGTPLIFTMPAPLGRAQVRQHVRRDDARLGDQRRRDRLQPPHLLGQGHQVLQESKPIPPPVTHTHTRRRTHAQARTHQYTAALSFWRVRGPLHHQGQRPNERPSFHSGMSVAKLRPSVTGFRCKDVSHPARPARPVCRAVALASPRHVSPRPPRHARHPGPSSPNAPPLPRLPAPARLTHAGRVPLRRANLSRRR